MVGTTRRLEAKPTDYLSVRVNGRCVLENLDIPGTRTFYCRTSLWLTLEADAKSFFGGAIAWPPRLYHFQRAKTTSDPSQSFRFVPQKLSTGEVSGSNFMLNSLTVLRIFFLRN